MKTSTKVSLSVLFLVSLITATIYTWTVIRDGHTRTDPLLNLVAELDQSRLKPSDLPDKWLRDLLAVEDPGFYEHNGIDLSTPGAGLTTITQGLVKIHYFDKFKPGLAKYKQSVFALVLDSRLTKEQQLILFLNTANLGTLNREQISGFERAATAYFDKPFNQLSYTEFISLVAMLVGPNRYNVATHPAENAIRVNKIMAFLAGECAAAGLADIYYKDCPSDSTTWPLP